eukprot:7696985-Prorocentrum_lima.AAC.1
MTSSLVGSEMCIRDSDWAILLRHDNPATLMHDIKALLDRVHQVTQECAVSYTHLTLPTICSV